MPDRHPRVGQRLAVVERFKLVGVQRATSMLVRRSPTLLQSC
jgi:hypothetical protein